MHHTLSCGIGIIRHKHYYSHISSHLMLLRLKTTNQMSNIFTNAYVVGLIHITFHSFVPHLGVIVHSNTVICLDIAILRSFLQEKSRFCCLLLCLQHKNVPNCLICRETSQRGYVKISHLRRYGTHIM